MYYESFYLVEELSKNEYEYAKEQHGDVYSSSSESYDVLNDELSEAVEEMNGLVNILSSPKTYDDVLFNAVEMRAKLCILECAQIVAVCRKSKDSIRGWNNVDKKNKTDKHSKS